MDFLLDKADFLTTLPALAIVAILGFIIFKTVVKTVIKIVLLIVLIILALLFWNGARGPVREQLGLESTLHIVREYAEG